MLHKNSASPLCDWQVKIFIFLTVYLTGSGSVSLSHGCFLIYRNNLFFEVVHFNILSSYYTIQLKIRRIISKILKTSIT